MAYFVFVRSKEILVAIAYLHDTNLYEIVNFVVL